MKVLFFSLFLTSIGTTVFAQIPEEIDYNSRQADYEQAQQDFLYLKDQAKVIKTEALNSDALLNDYIDRLNRNIGRRKISKARLEEIQVIVGQTAQKIKNLTDKLVILKKALPELINKEAQASEVVQKKKAKLASMEPKVAEVKAKIAELEASIEKNKKNKNALNTQLSSVKAEIVSANKEIEEKKNANALSIAAKTKLETVLAELPADSRKAKEVKLRIAKIAGSIKSNNEKIKANQDKVATFKTKKETLDASISEANNTISKLTGKKTELLASAGPTYQKYEELKVELSKAIERKKALTDKVKDSKAEMNELNNKVAKNKGKLKDLRQEKLATKEEILVLRDKIQNLKYRVDNQAMFSRDLWAQYDQADRQAVRANGRADALYAIFQETKARFDSYMNAAIQTGENQGSSLGQNEGEQTGETQGLKDGVRDGKELGKKLGLLQGFLAGLKSGYNDGKAQGYETGFNLPSNYEKGFQLGLSAGKEQAYQDAEDEDYPKGRFEKQQELLSRVLNGQSLYTTNNQGKLESVEGDYGYDYQGKTVKVAVSNTDPILNLIALVNEEINVLFDQIESLKENPVSGISISTPNRLSELRCPSDYPANYSEFIVACENSFVASFQTAYLNGFKSEYNNKYLESFEDLIDEQVAQNGSTREDEGYKKAYTPTFNKYKLIGAKEAQNKGYNDGHKKAYKDNIKEARKLAYNRGANDETKYFNTHSVIKLINAGLASSEGKFIPGAKVKLAVEVGNYGGVATLDRDVKVQVVSFSSGLSFTDSSSELSEIKALSKVTNSAILEATVGEDVQPGDSLKVKVNIFLGSQIVDSKIVTVSGQADYNAAMAIKANLTPKFRMFSLKEEVAIDITNFSKTKLVSGLSIVMKASHRDINILNTITNVGILKKGESTTVKIEYKGKKRLKRKKVTLTYDLVYKGQVIKTESIVIKPI